MGSDHHQHCDHAQGSGSKRSLIVAFVLTVCFMAAEAVGGWLTNSLALLSDAGHMLTDAGALGLSLLAIRVGELPPSKTKTFGYRRFEILAALLNGLALWGIVGIVLHEAYDRLRNPPEVQAVGMMLVAGLGFAVNLVSLRLLHAHKDENLNVRGAFLHVVADSLGSLGALTAGVVVATTGWNLADPLVSVAICGLILWSSWAVVRDAVHILLLGVPVHLNYADIQQAILEQEGVCCLYDLHVWSIATGQEALSVHLVVPDGYARQRDLLQRVTARLKERFGIEHATIQIEESHEMRDARADAICRVSGQGLACAHSGPSAGPSPETAEGRG